MTLAMKVKESVEDRMAAVRACRRALKAWVHCGLVQPNVLSKAVIKLLEERRMKHAMLCWSTVMNKRKKENERDEALERAAHFVLLNFTKRTKQHSWNAWLESRNVLQKEIKVMKLARTSLIVVMFRRWIECMNIMKKSDRVKNKCRLSSCKNVLIAWMTKVSWECSPSFIVG